MAHECPECGIICYCGGDIDDCHFDNPQYIVGCAHCPHEDYEDECWTDVEDEA